MSFQAYIDNIKAKTGKSPDDFRGLAVKKGLTKSGEIVTWLKDEFGLGHGHARAIAHLLVQPDTVADSSKDKFGTLFTAGKAKWRTPFEKLKAQIETFGADIEVKPNRTYVNVLRGKKFAILQPSSAERFDIGLKLKGVTPSGRLEAAGSWNNMVTHRVRVSDPKQIDAEVIAWLRQAYDAALGVRKI
jgi:hypothetical protein